MKAGKYAYLKEFTVKTDEKPVVLIVDDDGAWRESTRTFFQCHGFPRNDSASNLDTAMRAFHDHPNDQMIGFVDIQMRESPTAGLDVLQYGHEFVPNRAALYVVTGNPWNLQLENEVIRRGGLELLVKDPDNIFERMLIRVKHPNVLIQVSSSWRDPLTKLKILPTFQEDVLVEMTEMKDRKRWDTLHLIALDMRKFKEINDTYGHLVGDRCLKRVADVIRSQVRPKDHPCRRSGDEFLVCMAGVSRAQAIKTARAIQQAVADNPIEGREGLLIPLAIDWGLAELHRRHISYPLEALFTELMDTADERMYKNKQAAKEGRSRK